MEKDPRVIRARIEECRAELARAQGERESIQASLDADLARLRKLLKCKAGEEKSAVLALKQGLEESEAEVEELLSQIEGSGD